MMIGSWDPSYQIVKSNTVSYRKLDGLVKATPTGLRTANFMRFAMSIVEKFFI